MSSITSGLAHDVPFLPRPPVPGISLAAAQSAEGAVHGSMRSRCLVLCAFPRTSEPTGPSAYAAVTSIATIGSTIAYAIPIYLRLRLGDAWEPGEWRPRQAYRWIGVHGLRLGRVHRASVHGTAQSGRHPVKRQLHVAVGQLRAVAVLGTLTLVWGWWLLSARNWFKADRAGHRGGARPVEAQYEPVRRPVPRRPRRRIASEPTSEGAGGVRLPPRRRTTVLRSTSCARRRTRSTRYHGVHRHAGSLLGKRTASRLLLRQSARPRTEAATTLLALDMEMDPVRATEARVVGARLRRLQPVPGPEPTLPRIPWLEATALVAVRRGPGTDGAPVRRPRARCLRAQGFRAGARSLGFEVDGRLGAGSSYLLEEKSRCRRLPSRAPCMSGERHDHRVEESSPRSSSERKHCRPPSWRGADAPAPSDVGSEGRSYAEDVAGPGAAPGSYCASIRAELLLVPCAIGPLNQFRAQSSHQPQTRVNVPSTAIGAVVDRQPR